MAARAGVAVGLATYYFPTSDDLRLAAVDTLAAADLARMEAVVAGVRRRRRTAASTARLVVSLIVPGERDELVSWYERYVQGGRSPLLAGAASDEQARAMVRLLDDPAKFGGAYGLGIIYAGSMFGGHEG